MGLIHFIMIKMGNHPLHYILMGLGITGLIIFACFLTALGIASGMIEIETSYDTTRTVYYDIWDCDVSEGHYWVDTDGKIVFVFGYLSSDLRLTWTVKYLINGTVIRTVLLDAEKTDLVVDGTFQLEIFEDGTCIRDSKGEKCYWGKDVWGGKTEYRIHLPVFPERGETIKVMLGD